MKYSELINNRATPTEMRKYLVGGETVAITIRIPQNLRDSAKEAAALRGTSFSALLRECLINELTKENSIE
jgi:hypothetical protein